MEIEWNFESYQDFKQLAKTASKFTAAVEWKFTAGRVTGSRYPVHNRAETLILRYLNLIYHLRLIRHPEIYTLVA